MFKHNFLNNNILNSPTALHLPYRYYFVGSGNANLLLPPHLSFNTYKVDLGFVSKILK